MSNNKKKAWADMDVEDWSSYMAAKKGKLEEQFEEAAKKEFQDATSLFNGIAIFVNGYTIPCADELKRLMMANGGIYHHYMRSRVTTHIIASNLPYSKIVAYRKSQNPLPICKPEWITDSLKAGKVLDWRPYVLYSNCSKTQPSLQFEGKSSGSLLFAATVKSSEASVADSPESGNANPRVPSLAATSNGKESTSDRRSNSAPLCTKNAEFLSEFYNNSRLHHISTMGATFKDYVNELRAKNDGSFPGLDRLKTLPRKTATISPARNESDSEDDLFESPTVPEPNVAGKDPVIMHIDMDCFFVSVGLRNRPELRGLPVAVTHAKGNRQPESVPSKNGESDNDEDFGSMSEVASCSYEARKAGVKNGMFLGQALKLCPNLKTIKYDFEGYKEVSYSLYNTVASYTLSIEAVSCDEMYADVTSVLAQSQMTPLQFASVIRNEIREKTGCPVSTGFGCNKLQARLATRNAKPDGQFYLEPSQVRRHIGSIVVRDLPGVGSSTMQLLNKMKINTCADLLAVSLGLLQKEFGKKTGEMLHNMCRGIDNSKLNVEHVRKSVSAEVNYGIRFETGADADEFLRQLSREVCSRLQKANAKGRSLTLKLMVRAKHAPKEAMKFMGHGVCDNFTKSKNLIAPIDDPVIITKEVLSLWNQMQQSPEDIRGIGIQISRLECLKTKSAGASNMMNFISKGKVADSETSATCSKSVDKLPVESSINSIVPGFSGNGKMISTKKAEVPEPKSRGLKAFLVPKERLRPNNSSGPANRVGGSTLKKTNVEEIDESVLAQLPEDIRREILKSRGHNRVSSCVDPKPSTSAAAMVVEDERPAASSYKDEEKSSRNKFVSHAAEVSPMEGIDESVFNELPEDIRNEILGANKAASLQRKNIPNQPSRNRQTQQETYFKDAKPTSGKAELVEDERSATALHVGEKSSRHKFASRAAEVSPNEDIDESVFNELPENIRNEILGANNAASRLTKKIPSQPSRTRQTQQETFFKDAKPTSGKAELVEDERPATASHVGEKSSRHKLASRAAEVSPNEDIDESVFNELPENIRNEILGANNVASRLTKKIPNQPSRTRQTQQETFFKDAKPTSGKAELVEDERSATASHVEEKSSRHKFASRAAEVSPNEDIDESIFNELPENIRNEILGANNAASRLTKKIPSQPSRTRQTQQETYFKHTKPTSGKTGKAGMPPIEEIDMSVLIELPDDIRNEIINEYKANKRAREQSNNIDNGETIESREIAPTGREPNCTSRKERVENEADLSFSQVDPEFLAALSEDMKTDVQLYCMAKKKESTSKATKTPASSAAMKPLMKSTKNKNPTKQNKKSSRLPKSKNKAAIGAKGISNDRRNTKRSPEIARPMEVVDASEFGKRSSRDDRASGRFFESNFIVENREAAESLEQREEIISHHSSFIGNQAKSDEREMLTSLVNYLFTLPVQQVKMQIQTWISKSDVVNEIDLLSLATFLSMLPKKKRLEDLHILLKTMHRCITKTGSCVWHETYRRTVVHVQRYMQIEYKSNLMLPRIECDLRECKSNH